MYILFVSNHSHIPIFLVLNPYFLLMILPERIFVCFTLEARGTNNSASQLEIVILQSWGMLFISDLSFYDIIFGIPSNEFTSIPAPALAGHKLQVSNLLWNWQMPPWEVDSDAGSASSSFLILPDLILEILPCFVSPWYF